MMNYIAGMACGVGIWSLVITFLVPTKTKIYMDGQQSVRVEAFDKGFMVKKIAPDDKVVYDWIENK